MKWSLRREKEIDGDEDGDVENTSQHDNGVFSDDSDSLSGNGEDKASSNLSDASRDATFSEKSSCVIAESGGELNADRVDG